SCLLSTFPRTPISLLFPYTTLFRSICIWFCNWCNGWFNSCNISTLIKMGKGNVLPFSYIVSKYSYHCPCPTSSYLVWIWRASKRSEEHTSELQSRFDLVCRLLLEKK